MNRPTKQALFITAGWSLATVLGCVPDFPGGGGAGNGGPPPDYEYELVEGSCTPVWHAVGEAGQRLGSKVAGLQDVNGDGRPDVAVVGTDTSGDGSVIQVRSGSTGGLLRSIAVPARIDALVQVGDLDRDGVADVAVAGSQTITGDVEDDGVVEPGTRRRGAWGFSAATGTMLWERFGAEGDDGFASSLAGTSDQDSDGTDDVLMGWTSVAASSVPGRVLVISGVEGTDLDTIDAPPNSSEMFGNAVLDTGDLNEDGTRDYWIADVFGPADIFGAGVVHAISGEDRSSLWSVVGEVTGETSEPDLLGDSIAASGDLNADTTADLIVGAHNRRVPEVGPDVPGLGMGVSVGRALAVDGRTGSPLWSREGRRQGEHFGLPVASSGDLNGDGVADVLAGAPTPGFPVPMLGQGGRFVILDGSDGSVLVDVEAVVGEASRSDELGIALDGIGDVAGDANPEVIVAAPGAETDGAVGAGIVIVWSCKTE